MCFRNGDELFQQSFPLHIHHPGTEANIPSSLFGGQSGFGRYYGVQPFHTPMWSGTKIYFTSSP